MKTRILVTVLFLFFGINSFAQEKLDDLIEAETKSAASKVNFRANANTANYDLTYHRLEFELDPAVAYISGNITSHFIAKQDLNQVVFDLADNMVVSGVTRNGINLSFSQTTDDELIIDLPAVQPQGVLDSLTVSYSGNPISSGFGSFEQTTHNGDPIIWTLSEPYGAKAWWPCKQDLNDKINSIDVYITTPTMNPDNEEYIAVSNGVEQGITTNGNFKTTHYRHQFPIPAYLIAIAATNYDIYTEVVPNNGNPFDIVNYVFPENLAEAQAGTPVTLDIMNLFIEKFEAYPFEDEKYGHAEFGWGGGMEHTTVSFMGNFSRNLIAHELAHQWFGNKITCGSWKDIWLNEGFATYLSGMVIEEFDGDQAFADWKNSFVQNITSAPDGAVYLTDQDTTNVSRIFNGRLSYRKGAMVLHMLRKKLGDAVFFQGLQDYLAHPDLAFDYAKTEDLIPIMEAASGQDLTEFFNDWLFDEGYPSYTIEWQQLSDVTVRFNISQTQSHASVDYFQAPVPLQLIGTMGEQLDIVLENNINNEEFFQTVDFDVSEVIFDPQFDLISKDNSVLLNDDEFALEELNIFPNPVNDILYISKPENMEISAIQIFNILGQLINERSFSPILNMEPLSSGIHFFRFETNQGKHFKTILKR